jgi:hypothetical protein
MCDPSFVAESCNFTPGMSAKAAAGGTTTGATGATTPAAATVVTATAATAEHTAAAWQPTLEEYMYWQRQQQAEAAVFQAAIAARFAASAELPTVQPFAAMAVDLSSLTAPVAFTLPQNAQSIQ